MLSTWPVETKVHGNPQLADKPDTELSSSMGDVVVLFAAVGGVLQLNRYVGDAELFVGNLPQVLQHVVWVIDCRKVRSNVGAKHLVATGGFSLLLSASSQSLTS